MEYKFNIGSLVVFSIVFLYKCEENTILKDC